FYGIISALESQRKSLQEIKIWNCDYSAEFEVLMNCENLTTVRIIDCEEKKLLNALDTSLYKISTLEISSHTVNAQNIIQILEKSGSLLQRLRIYSEDQEICSQSLLLDTLMTFCPNIIYLDISYIKFSTQLSKFIDKLQKLQFLTLVWINDGSEEEMKGRVMEFAKILPQTLQYLNLGDNWINSHIDILLDNSLIGFCIRKKTLNDVNVSRYVNKTTYVFRFRSSNVTNTNWKKVQKDLEGYVNLLPYENIVIDC
ncbi:5285_t:CDS:2, partial [Cetraspora pellucida]